jgi:hypothetical protein
MFLDGSHAMGQYRIATHLKFKVGAYAILIHRIANMVVPKKPKPTQKLAF